MSDQPVMKRYRIGDYARYMGVTPDFLKHYEQLGLITPSVRENGYRYYPFNQSSRLLDCLSLRSYGVPLKEMGAMLREDDLPAIRHKLDERCEAMQKRIAFEQAVVAEHERLRRWLTRMEGRQEDWRVIDYPANLFLPHTDLYTFLDDPRIYSLLDGWTPYMPMVKSCLRIRADVPHAGEPRYCWGLSVLKAFAETHGLPLNDVVQELPACKVFVLDFCGYQAPSGVRYADAQRQRLLERMAALNLRPAGDIFMVSLLHMHDGKRREDSGYLFTPVQ